MTNQLDDAARQRRKLDIIGRPPASTEHSVPAFNEANRRKVDPDACACREDDDGNILYCPLHRAAPDLLTRLKESTTALLITARLIESGGSVKVGALDEEAQRNRDVIAKAEEDK